MNEKKTYNSKKVIIFSCFSVLFGLLSFISYSFFEKVEVVIDNDPIVLLNQSSNDKVLKLDSVDVKEPTVLGTKEEVVKKEKINILSLSDLKGKYVVVIGTFRNKNNAINLRNQMHQDGNNSCEIIFNGTHLYWVYFKSYDELIYAKKDVISFKIDGWIKKI
tara:strand:+ start:66 stop:551 length:486 start_codon:yes stop_codon:yes gene_type:complete